MRERVKQNQGNLTSGNQDMDRRVAILTFNDRRGDAIVNKFVGLVIRYFAPPLKT
jgi:hypothetical protein